jgi:hypothetical protein
MTPISPVSSPFVSVPVQPVRAVAAAGAVSLDNPLIAQLSQGDRADFSPEALRLAAGVSVLRTQMDLEATVGEQMVSQIRQAGARLDAYA